MNDTGLTDLVQMFPYAVVGGIVIAAACSLLGVFVILKRVVFIGVALSEVAACGIATALVCGFHPFIGASAFSLAAVTALAQPFEPKRLPKDAFLGVLFVLAASVSILLVSKSGFGLHEVKALLYGDLILTSKRDLVIILATLLPVVACLLLFLRPTLFTFLDRDAALAMQLRVRVWELLYFVALGLAVSAASSVAGALLVFCYLVVAPAAALLLSRRLWLVMTLAAGIAIACTVIGMVLSFTRDLPTNQTIAVCTCAAFVVALGWAGVRRCRVG
ncbi:MAG: metal ABC transporter permease [Victivallales bacterium]|nr:metal ABC transporter permease [Victivallales bacterium]